MSLTISETVESLLIPSAWWMGVSGGGGRSGHGLSARGWRRV